MCFPRFLLRRAVPMRARLSDSVPPEVKRISPGFTFRVFAICSLAVFT